ncbi:hypothetical protein GGI21_004858, partial [Coemansia aciculifera]
NGDARILAVARVYRALGSANIVRRDEIASENSTIGGSRVVKGTLPVAIVPKKISALWGLKNFVNDEDDAYYDDDEAGGGVESSGGPMPTPLPPVAYTPSPAMLGMMHSSSVPSIPSIPVVPSMPVVPSIPSMPSAYSPVAPVAQPLGFNPMLMPQAPPSGGIGSGYSMDSNGYGYGGGGVIVPMPDFGSYDSIGNGNVPAYNPMALQQQIHMFQEQQRLQQQLFFQQLSEQYGQMVVSPPPPPNVLSSVPGGSGNNHYYDQQQHMSYSTYGPPPPPPSLPAQPALAHSVSTATPTPPPTTHSSVPVSTDYHLYDQQQHILPQHPPAPVHSVSTSTPTPQPPQSLAIVQENTASVTSAVAPDVSGPARPDSAAEIDSGAAAENGAVTSEPNRDAAESEAEVDTLPPPIVVVDDAQPTAAADSSAEMASTNSNGVVVPLAATPSTPTANSGRHSPPPNYDDLLPPDYDIPGNQPPPYRPLESNGASRRRMWNIQ